MGCSTLAKKTKFNGYHEERWKYKKLYHDNNVHMAIYIDVHKIYKICDCVSLVLPKFCYIKHMVIRERNKEKKQLYCW